MKVGVWNKIINFKMLSSKQQFFTDATCDQWNTPCSKKLSYLVKLI